MLSPLTGRLRPKPNDIGQMDLISKEPAPEESGVVKFLHVGLLLLGQPEASSGKEQAAVRGRCAGRLPFRVVVMIVVDMISIGPTPSNRIMPILPSSAGADGGLSW